MIKTWTHLCHLVWKVYVLIATEIQKTFLETQEYSRRISPFYLEKQKLLPRLPSGHLHSMSSHSFRKPESILRMEPSYRRLRRRRDSVRQECPPQFRNKIAGPILHRHFHLDWCHSVFIHTFINIELSWKTTQDFYPCHLTFLFQRKDYVWVRNLTAQWDPSWLP